MEKFENVTVVKKANIYFEGKVTSRKIEFNDGTIKTLGIMSEGEYTFGTDAPELMEILAGEVEVKLPNSEKWISVKAGESFEVAGDSKFDIKVNSLTDYCCSYL